MIWKFDPLTKRTIWGGGSLYSMYPALASTLQTSDANDIHTDNPVGEIWLLSGVEGSESVVSSGPDKGKSISKIISADSHRILGKGIVEKYGDKFPLLIKFIDAADDLSIQVHPDDDMARSVGLDRGKSEMWYVVSADTDARLAVGFKEPQDPKSFQSMTEMSDICDLLRYSYVSAGDVFYIPPGRIHLLGAGCKVLEIQQTSDVTYRLFDYNRKDKDGRYRELHTELGNRALNYDDIYGYRIAYNNLNHNAILVSTPHFTVRRLLLSAPLELRHHSFDSFRIFIALSGSATVTEGEQTLQINPGECLLASADSTARIIPDGEFTTIETYIEG